MTLGEGTGTLQKRRENARIRKFKTEERKMCIKFFFNLEFKGSSVQHTIQHIPRTKINSPVPESPSVTMPICMYMTTILQFLTNGSGLLLLLL